MVATERGALLALLRTSGQPWSAVTEQVEAVGSALAVLKEGFPGQLSLVHQVQDPEQLAEQADTEIETWEREGMRFHTFLEASYPAQLLTVHQRPPFVMTRGEQSENDARGVAVVGTRGATERGLRSATWLARALALEGVPVISGLATGIDTAAHIGALSAEGRTVAVIGTGLRRSYPAENRDLQERISRVGLVLSQFLPDMSPMQKTFPMRNAIMSGYGAATVVVEAPFKSGARMQARLALEHGRRVFLLETLLENSWARDYAERPNTTIVRKVEDVLDHLESALNSDNELVRA